MDGCSTEGYQWDGLVGIVGQKIKKTFLENEVFFSGACREILLTAAGGAGRGWRRGENFKEAPMTISMELNDMTIGGRPCLLGLLHPRLQLPQPDHTEQRAGLPHCQGGASQQQQQQQQRHISNNYPHHKLQKRITQSSE